MDKALLTEVKAILKSLVLSCPEKITIDKLNRDYREMEGQYIPFRQLGFGNLEQFLHSIPDTLRVFGSGPTAMVCFVPNEKSDHIHDMIMRQKKPKARKKPKSNKLGSWGSRSNQISSRKTTSTQQSAKISGQQLSPYQSNNRNLMTKTVQVRGLPSAVQVPNYVSSQMFYNLPQPNGIIFNPQQVLISTNTPVLSSINKGLIHTLCNQRENYGTQAGQVSNLLKKQRNVSSHPPPLPSHQNRAVDFSSTTKPSVQVNEKIQNERKESPKKFTGVKVSNEPATESISINEITAANVKKQVSIKASHEEESMPSMPTLRKFTSPIESSMKNLSIGDIQKETNLQKETKNESTITEKKISRFKPSGFFDDSIEGDDDTDEAVPSFAAKNNVFRFDYPEYTVPHGNKITPYELPEYVGVGSIIKIFVTEIHNPYKFWFHIHKDNHEVDLLMHQIECYYSRLDSEDMRIPTACLTPGQVCAACYNGLWHRAEIVAPPVNTTIKVSFMDYGTVAELEIKNIKFLGTYFAQLPAQAGRGCLSHIKPRTLHWSHAATKYFLKLVSDLMLYAKVTEIDRQNNILCMILCDTNGNEVIQINKSMVETGHAIYDEEWEPERIKRNNGQRLHHLREDFPTFSMIESGEYPSYHELVSLQQRGIDYEAIYDVILYNPTILNKHESATERLRNLPYYLTTTNPFRSEILFELYAKTSTAI